VRTPIHVRWKHLSAVLIVLFSLEGGEGDAAITTDSCGSCKRRHRMIEAGVDLGDSDTDLEAGAQLCGSFFLHFCPSFRIHL
jgi:hypothetical protein